MAKVYSTAGISREPNLMVDGKYDDKAYDAEVKRYTREVREYAQKTHSGIWVGEVIRFQVADGYAQYMVFSQKPLSLFHLNIGDGYQADPILLRGLLLSDVKKLVAHEQALRELFRRPKKPRATSDV